MVTGGFPSFHAACGSNPRTLGRRGPEAEKCCVSVSRQRVASAFRHTAALFVPIFAERSHSAGGRRRQQLSPPPSVARAERLRAERHGLPLAQRPAGDQEPQVRAWLLHAAGQPAQPVVVLGHRAPADEHGAQSRHARRHAAPRRGVRPELAFHRGRRRYAAARGDGRECLVPLHVPDARRHGRQAGAAHGELDASRPAV